MISTGNCVIPHSSKPWHRAGPKLAWALVLAGGFVWLLSYQMRAGAPAAAPDHWPAEAGLSLDPARSNLVMFAHPRCPCSEASLEELKIVLTRGREEIKATLCFITPEGVPADWTQTSLVRAARDIPGLNVVVDRDGSIAAKFGALTSGQILMYDGRGERVFAGGITPARGHVGENRGRALVLALARNEVCGSGPTPVFGCALQESPGPKKDAMP
jgi:hypothetical protein